MAKSTQALLYRVYRNQLKIAKKYKDTITAANSKGSLIQVPRTGKRITSAYEQFRNAAEYAEEHLLLQRAIRRFYMRELFLSQNGLGGVGDELIIELTQAGYLKNKTISTETVGTLNRLIKKYMRAYARLRSFGVDRDTASRWVLDILSVETEENLYPHGEEAALAYTAYEYYLKLLPRKKLSLTSYENSHFEVSLYIAIHLALLKSDSAIIRHDLMKMHDRSPAKIHDFIEFNERLDEVLGASFTQRLKRAVSKFGAPFRVLREMSEDRPDIIDLLNDRDTFLHAYDQQVNQEYRRVQENLNRGVVKSVIFLFITKVIIGLAIEVPYDILVHGYVAVLPLAINLLFPPLYIISVRIFLRLPSRSNAVALRDSIDKILYSENTPKYPAIRLGPRNISVPARIVYSILFLIPIVIIVAVLNALEFNIVQGVIFFVFLSTASFLGFRLSRIIREIEIEVKQSGFFTTISDFFYLPFIIIGQWISSKYARVNATALILDMAIELPLKSGLRLLRQWSRFLNERREEIY